MNGSIAIQSFSEELQLISKLKYARKSSLICRNKEIHMKKSFNSNIAKHVKDFWQIDLLVVLAQCANFLMQKEINVMDAEN